MNPIEIEFNINCKTAIGKIKKATEATENLRKAFAELKHLEIGVEVYSTEMKWWRVLWLKLRKTFKKWL